MAWPVFSLALSLIVLPTLIWAKARTGNATAKRASLVFMTNGCLCEQCKIDATIQDIQPHENVKMKNGMRGAGCVLRGIRHRKCPAPGSDRLAGRKLYGL